MSSRDQISALTDASTSAVWLRQTVTQFSHHLIPPKNVDMVKMILLTYCWQMGVHDDDYSFQGWSKKGHRRNDPQTRLQDEFPLSFLSKEQFAFHIRGMIIECTLIHCYTPLQQCMKPLIWRMFWWGTCTFPLARFVSDFFCLGLLCCCLISGYTLIWFEVAHSCL